MLCTYTLKNPADIHARQFTPEQQKAATAAPVFPQGAALSVSKNSPGSYTICAPAAAADGSIVFVYRAAVLGKNGKVIAQKTLVNDYWIADCYDEVSFTVYATSGCTVQVTAENAYGTPSEALTAQIP